MCSMNRHAEMSETRRSIADAAEELFAVNGIERVTTRALAARARVNTAAVNYHFGGKAALTLQVFREVARRTARRRIRSLDALEAGQGAPGLREVVDAFVDAYLNEDDPRSGRLLARFVLKHRVEPSEGMAAVVAEELDEMALRYVAALGRAAPWLAPEEVHLRYHLMVGAILMMLRDDDTGARIERLSEGACRTGDAAALRAGIVGFLEASFGPAPARAAAATSQGGPP